MLLIVIGFLLIPLGSNIQAQPFEITWWKVSGGGGTATASGYRLSGTTGQPEAGLLSAGGYTLLGGFWGMDIQQFIYLPLILRN